MRSRGGEVVRTMRRRGSLLMLAGALGLWAWSPAALAVPSYARQTGVPCNVCHTSYPGLTAFGRQFKLNGYVLSGEQQVQAPESAQMPGVSINQIPNISVILQADEEYLSKPMGGASHWHATFPKEFGVYYAGEIAPHLGSFLQLTYAQGEGVSIDMSDLRYVRTFNLGGKPAIWGVDLNNMPTVEDVWNSTPAYGWPYVEGAMTPMPFISSDTVMTNVLGVGSYLYWNNLLYGYVGVYQSTPQGGSDGIHGPAPYFRVAVTPLPELEVGAFGLFATRPCYTTADPGADDPLAPSDTTACGSRGHVNDIGVDTQYQWQPTEYSIYTVHGRYTHEAQTGLDRTYASNYAGPGNVSADFINADVEWVYRHRWGLSAGVFGKWGEASTYYNAVFGDDFRTTSKPNTFGETVQADYWPWQNVRLSLQYTVFNMFNGATSNYNGMGRNAMDNNLLVLNALFGF